MERARSWDVAGHPTAWTCLLLTWLAQEHAAAQCAALLLCCKVHARAVTLDAQVWLESCCLAVHTEPSNHSHGNRPPSYCSDCTSHSTCQNEHGESAVLTRPHTSIKPPWLSRSHQPHLRTSCRFAFPSIRSHGLWEPTIFFHGTRVHRCKLMMHSGVTAHGRQLKQRMAESSRQFCRDCCRMCKTWPSLAELKCQTHVAAL